MRLPNIFVFLFFSTILLLSSCSSVEYPPDQAPRMLVASDATPFYLHGPAQGFGADRTLIRGDEVRVLRKDFGYSFVELHDGLRGYVANEVLVIAPPMPSHKKCRARNHYSPPQDQETFFPQPGFRY